MIAQNNALVWGCYNDCLKKNLHFWYSATSKTTSMGLGSQKGFVANPVNAPNISEVNYVY